MVRLFQRLKFHRVVTEEKYRCMFRLSFPVRKGYVETKDIRTFVNAYSKQEAKNKAKRFIEKNINIVFIEIEKS